MNSSINAIRAFSAYSAKKTLGVITIVLTIVLVLLVALIAYLAITISPWWCILLLPIVLFSLIFMIIRFLVLKAINKLHRHPFTTKQKQALEEFSSDIKSASGSISVSPQHIALSTLIDVATKHDVSTLKSTIDSTQKLKSSFDNLKDSFGER